ncbi:MAG: UvrD-helicase domain-containing protein [Syntrophobacteraceae bacterium]
MTVLADAAKRTRAVDPAGSFHLEAPAGSGKTYLLTARFLRLLGLVEHPQQILALTFTNKAAGEMRERVGRYLDRAAKRVDPKDPADAELLDFAKKALAAHKNLEELLLFGEILRIQTFHSFCYAVASQAPLEAGLTPGSTLMDDNEQEFFLRETVDSALREIAARDPEDHARRALQNRLLYLNNSWRHLADEMEEMMRRREGMYDLVRELDRDRAAGHLTARVRELVETALGSLGSEFATCALARGWTQFLDDMAAAGAPAASSLPPRIPPPAWESLGEWRRMAETFLTVKGEVRKQPGPNAGFHAGFSKTRWGEALQAIPAATAQKLDAVRSLPSLDAPVRDPDTLWDLVLLFHAVLDLYDARCRGRRALDFSALETAALRLFDAAEPSDLQLILDQRIRHILVDEFQDTSRGQWELLQKLCAGWIEGDGRTLFLVGDPKQSIYGFRKAEVKLFMDAARGLPLEDGGKVSLEALVLDTNFRSRPRLIDWCNGLFGQSVMADHKPEFDEVPFSPAVPPTTREDGGQRTEDGGQRTEDGRWRTEDGGRKTEDGRRRAGDGGTKSEDGGRIPPAPLPLREGLGEGEHPDIPELALFIEWPDRESARRREARWLAGKVAAAIRKNGPDSENGILLFSRTHLPIYLEALQEMKIPVQVKEGLKLLDRPEVRHLLQLCRAMVLPQDDLAWAAQLRSPWLFLDFDRVLAVSREEPGPWVEKIRSFSEKDKEVGRFWETLTTAWRHISHEPLARVMESAWIELGGARIAGRRWGSRGLNCCLRFLDMIRKAEEGEPVATLTRLEQLLESAFEPVDPDTASSNVFLMTVHGAKGLEFDTVFIPFLDWDPAAGKRGQPPPYMLERSPGSGDYLLAPRPDRLMGEEDPLYNLLRKLRARRKLGEARRLFYVAATRARNELVMSAVARKRSGGFTAGKDTPLGWLNTHYSLDELAGLGDITPPGESAAGAASSQCPAGAASSREDSPDVLNVLRRTVRSEDGCFSVLIEPRTREAVESRPEARPVAVNPAPFERETPSLKVISPSSLIRFAREDAPEPPPPKPRPIGACTPELRGTLIHRLLAEFAKTGTLPGSDKIRSFLRREGVDESEAENVARDALAEARSCLADPWLRRFHNIPPEDLKVEWPLESPHTPDTLYAGVIDLVAKIDGTWTLLDFKTSRPAPGEPVEEFRRRELDLYRPQLTAYREMWAKLAGVDADGVEVFIYWTALRKAGKCED